ncbi:MAG: STAS domain-containing protein [Chloroflexi bacterium]|nr:STAS domain-containing protein [Chloroflexota bacterium]
MDIATDQPSADLAVIALTGELDGSNFEQVIGAGRAARDGGASRIVLDLAGLTYMGSSGLVAIHSIALLLHGQEPTSPEDGWQAIHDIGTGAAADDAPALVLAGPPPAVHRVLDRSGMLSLFPVHADREAAVAAASA